MLEITYLDVQSVFTTNKYAVLLKPLECNRILEVRLHRFQMSVQNYVYRMDGRLNVKQNCKVKTIYIYKNCIYFSIRRSIFFEVGTYACADIE